jgi:hypothetical protein
MRLLLGIVGTAALLAGAGVAATELRWLTHGSPAVSTLLATAVAVLVMLGGLHLVRGALRGRIVVRATGFRRSTGQRSGR